MLSHHLFQAHLQKALQDNLVLAQEYTTLQKALMIARQEAVCVFDKRNAADASIQDHEQVTVITTNIPNSLHVRITPLFCMCV